ncbi:MAG: hypothetical protein LQ343_005504 [Gyalolechia ehrenbergii]|nr:MAG: hypothetical protein LQ343_005504 [Gyalolechia ehrenbergii]
MATIIPTWEQPSHPNLFEIVHRSDDFRTFARSKVNLPPGSILAAIEGATVVNAAAYFTFQAAPDIHMVFNSDFMYFNHSCDPNTVFDFERSEVRVIKHVHAGDSLTWFYPSSEWDMVQPFHCRCGASCCRGWIAGASQLDSEVLQEYWLNNHISMQLRDNASGYKERDFRADPSDSALPAVSSELDELS